jgi:subtilisin family serine protease
MKMHKRLSGLFVAAIVCCSAAGAVCEQGIFTVEEVVVRGMADPGEAIVRFPTSIEQPGLVLLQLFNNRRADKFGAPVTLGKGLFRVPIPVGEGSIQAKAGRLVDSMKLLKLISEIKPDVIPPDLVSALKLTPADIVILTEPKISNESSDEVFSDLRRVIVEPDLIVSVLTTPSDAEFPKQCGLKAINAETAWDRTYAAPKVKIAIIDTGLADHLDLPNAKRKNTPADVDRNGHGTAVAGTVGAAKDDRLGIVGVVWNADITAYRFLDASGRGKLADAYNAINQAATDGANIIILPWGGGAYSPMFRDILESYKDTILFVAAAGNDGKDACKESPVYPAAYQLDNVISVMATTCDDLRPRFSNYGDNVDLAAPGEGLSRNLRIYSTVLHERWGNLAGTSMSAAFVGGAAALVLQRSIDEGSPCTPAKIKAWLNRSVDALAPLYQKSKTGGRLNLFKAVGGDDTCND